jgi:hypothetical protein
LRPVDAPCPTMSKVLVSSKFPEYGSRHGRLRSRGDAQAFKGPGRELQSQNPTSP